MLSASFASGSHYFDYGYRLETHCTENWAGALHTEAVRCIVPIDREMKTKIPDEV